MLKYILCAFLLIVPAQLQVEKYEGETCLSSTGAAGVCQSLATCDTAQKILEIAKVFPVICSFKKTELIVCCPPEVAGAPTTTTAPPPPATTPKIEPTTARTTETPQYSYEDIVETDESGCEKLSANLTAAKTNSKSWNKCIEYQMKLVYPCERTEAILRENARKSKCHHNVVDLIVGGTDAKENEFPHMALLGYGSDIRTLQWFCGGTIISENFILTAGHCTSASRIGPVTYAKVGILTRNDPDDNSKMYGIDKIIKHPQYNSPNRYHDIALLRTKRPIVLSDLVVPACLDVGSPNNYNRALATGWGATRNRGSNADHLQQVVLNQFTTEECAEMFPSHRLMLDGFDERTQICYGDKDRSKDTCQGDSGGPLVLYSREIHCMYVVAGITSFGRACGVKGEPGIYTRVSHYVPWIEGVVWPQ